MSSLFSIPHSSTDDFLVNAADWVEVSCLLKADCSVSREELKQALRKDSKPSDERAESMASDAFLELEDRITVCGGLENAANSYPFLLNETKTSLQIKYPFRSTSEVACLYWFLLLISQMSMESKARVLEKIDPTKVFERLCADVLAGFWAVGGPHSGSFVFGTAAKESGGTHAFRQNIEQLCKHVGEGGGWNPGAKPPSGGDGKLDIVCWRKFNDGRPGNLVGFAQCKTGVNWKEHLDKLRPAQFSRKYMRQEFFVEPVRLYMVPSRVERSQWNDHTHRAGILLDRCRITQYGHTIRPEILSQCRAWVHAAIQRENKKIASK